MKTFKVTIEILILILCFYSCNNKQKHINEIIEINLDNLSKDITSYVDTVFFIALENNEDAIIGTKPHIKLYKDLLYIRNNNENKIFIFNREGKYISTFNKYGQGTDEYTSIANYGISEDELWIYDYVSRRVLIYNNQGKLMKKVINIGDGEDYCIEYNNCYILFNEDLDPNHILLTTYNKDGKMMNKVTMTHQHNHYYHIERTPLSIINDTLLFVMYADYNIYSLNSDSVKIAYTLDFKNHNMPKDFRLKTQNIMNFQQEDTKLFMNNQVSNIDNIIQSGKWILSIIEKAGNNIVLLNLQDDTFYSLDALGLVFECVDGRINTDGEYFITTIQADYCSTFKSMFHKGTVLDKYTTEFQYMDAEDEDNPLLCFIKLK